MSGDPDRSFLNLWSYPNVFIDKKADRTGDGKELCDLLVVCGDHVLIFSDKTIAWPAGETELAWKRWYKRAIHKSVAQIRGAERWIAQFPERIFVDRACTQRLPIPLPPPDRRKVQGIVVALGAGEACRAHFGEGSGSLMIIPRIKGDDHVSGGGVLPFCIGDVDPDGPFVHVIDDASLDVVMGELDTVTDFTNYLNKKEALIRSGRLISAAGEEDLVSQFMTQVNAEGEHDFIKPDGTPWREKDGISYGSGLYEELLTNPQYLAKKQADSDSYVWDRLIETFTNHIMAGTSIVPEGLDFNFSEHELAARHMALVNRFNRRIYGQNIIEVLRKGQEVPRFMRAFLPADRRSDTGFFFMTLEIPDFELPGGYEQYRAVRRDQLLTYAFSILEQMPQFTRVIGIGTESPAKGRGASEDLVYVETPEWNDELRRDVAERREKYDIGRNEIRRAARRHEFPAVPPRTRAEQPMSHGLNRHERRRRKSEARRQARKER